MITGQDKIALSILDYVEVRFEEDPHLGLQHTLHAARLADELGYRRYWLTEHWDPFCATPCIDILTSVIASSTKRIRVGTAGILLHLYPPLRLASSALLTESLFPGRIDLGFARGEPPDPVRMALGANLKTSTEEYAAKFAQTLEYLEYRDELKVLSPGGLPPEIWNMATSLNGAKLAAALGANLAISLFHSLKAPEPSLIEEYYASFRPSPARPGRPKACIALSGICDETETAAHRAAKSHADIKVNIIGTPDFWHEEIARLCRLYDVREVVILEVHAELDARNRGMALLAERFELARTAPRQD